MKTKRMTRARKEAAGMTKPPLSKIERKREAEHSSTKLAEQLKGWQADG